MKYVISEEELKDFAIKCVNDDGVSELSIDVRIQDLTQSKTPVEEIAEGELYDTCMSAIPEFHVGNKNLNNLLEDYQGKNIKIYIEVIK